MLRLEDSLRYVTAGAAALLLAACASASGMSGTASRGDLRGTDWTLVALNGAAPAGAAPTLSFGEQYRVTGEAGCNSFYGIYGLDEDGVAIRSIEAAQNTCADAAVMQLESTYLSLLRDAETLAISDDGRLSVSGDAGTAVFAPTSS